MAKSYCVKAEIECKYFSNGCCMADGFCKGERVVHNPESALAVQLAYMTKIMENQAKIMKQLRDLGIQK